jgi:branched-subunit amino acid ABC-type transport system permease component
MMAGLAALVYRTKLGTAMRATAQNPQIAGLMGIDANRVIAFTFVIGAALAAGAAAGVAAHAIATGVNQMRERRRQLPVVDQPPKEDGHGRN